MRLVGCLRGRGARGGGGRAEAPAAWAGRVRERGDESGVGRVGGPADGTVVARGWGSECHAWSRGGDRRAFGARVGGDGEEMESGEEVEGRRVATHRTPLARGFRGVGRALTYIRGAWAPISQRAPPFVIVQAWGETVGGRSQARRSRLRFGQERTRRGRRGNECRRPPKRAIALIRRLTGESRRVREEN